MKTYLIQQKITAFVNQYKVFEEAPSNGTNLVAFAQQKRFAFREKFNLFSDESQQLPLAEIQARQVLDFGARYDIRLSNSETAGVIGKAFGSSLLRSTWNIYKPGAEDTPIMVVTERNATVAIVRRLWDFIPILSDFPFVLRYHFNYSDPATGKVVARLDKTTLIKDHYRLEVEDAGLATTHWVTFVAMGIMLDALQGR
ncbi:MAG: hypothetical protein QFB86_02585 [Patescibacteria group bacterium]|nr:hypothetical protein [Patescibacteria group bacterium]